MFSLPEWFIWALLSAAFAALTAIFAKVGLEGVDSDLATLIRTFLILLVLGAFVVATDKWVNPAPTVGKDPVLPRAVCAGDWRLLGILFPRAESGASVTGRTHRQAVAGDGGDFCRDFSRRTA